MSLLASVLIVRHIVPRSCDGSLETMDVKIGLSTREAFFRLCGTLQSEIDKENKRLHDVGSFSFRFLAHNALITGGLCTFYAIATFTCCSVLLFGTFLRDCSLLDQLASILFVAVTTISFYLSSKVYNLQRFFAVTKAANILNTLKSLREEDFDYEHLYAPPSDAISLQWTYRDHKLVNVPWMLLVAGDMIELRAGQAAPCRCASLQGDIINVGEKARQLEQRCPETGGIIPSRPTLWKVVESPVVEHVRGAFRSHRREHSNLLNSEIITTLHFSLEKCLFPIVLSTVIGVGCFRYFLVSENFADFLVNAALIIIPLLGPMVPIYCFLGKLWNLGFVLGDGYKLRYSEPNSQVASSRVFVDKNRKGVISAGFKAVYQYFTGDIHTSIDFIFTCGGLTSCAFLDRKGLLSWPNATVEKILCFHNDDHNKQGRHRKVAPKILDLTLDGKGPFSVHFDEPSWERYKGSLLPIGISSFINGCSQLPNYTSFCDHINAMSETVPNATAIVNKHCLCPLTQLLGISEEISKDFSNLTTKTIAFYKRSSGQGQNCERRKFGTPLENAFLTITKDARAEFYHAMSQGTAELLLSACSHVWCENSLEPYTLYLHKRVLDFYQRNTMTGACLIFGYRTLGCTISDSLSERYIDVSVLKEIEADIGNFHLLPRTVSLDLECLNAFYRQFPLHNAQECFEEVMSGQALCGLVVLQHQARSDVVQLVEELDFACIRFIYFSKENELRSRIFAEKLGLEAGWNCHISLANKGEEQGIANTALNEDKNLCSRSLKMSMPRCATWSEHRLKDRCSIGSVENGTRYSKKGSYDSSFPPHFCSLPTQLSSKSAAMLTGNQSHHAAYSWSEETARESFPNKARLPSGISNIRPHLKNVDNVPLLVSLFTDCDFKSTQEMISIMQDYGEVVFVVGSSLNYFNGNILSQGNCAVAVEPQHPLLCSKQDLKSAHVLKKASTVATLLMGLCSDIITFPNQTLDFISLISFCRHQLRLFRSSLLFFLFSSMALLLQQIFSLLLLLPNLLTVSQVFLFIIVYLPLIALSLITSPREPSESRDEIAPKNVPSASKRLIRRAIVYFAMNFFPTQLLISFIYYSTIVSARVRYGELEIVKSSLYSFDHSVMVGRHVATFYLLLYFCALSEGFVYCRHNCWTKNPLNNCYWVAAMCCVVLIQIAYTSLSAGSLLQFIILCNIWVTAISFFWLVIIVIISELCKFRFIKLYRRDQRRRKLSFNTKLGMNSPY